MNKWTKRNETHPAQSPPGDCMKRDEGQKEFKGALNVNIYCMHSAQTYIQ